MDNVTNRLSRNRTIFIALFVACTVVGASSSEIHHQYAVELRRLMLLVAGALLLLLSVNTLRRKRVQKDVLVAFCVTSYLFLHGYVLATEYGGSIFFEQDQRLILFLAMAFLLSITYYGYVSMLVENAEIQDDYKFLSMYFIGTLLAVVALGGISFSPLPTINFGDYDGQLRRYSQDFTSFFAMGAVWFIVLGFNARRRDILLLAAGLLFLVFSMLGGARGDFLAGVVVILLCFIRRLTLWRVFLMGIISLGAYTYLFQSGLWERILIFSRLKRLLAGDFGAREFFIIDAVSLLQEKMDCLIHGCGFNYFQFFYRYEYGMYPHNIIVEVLIVYGIIIGAPLIILALIGVATSYFGWGKENPVYYILLVDFLTLLKSGSLVGFTSIPLLVLFSAIGAKACFRPRVQRTVAYQ